MVVVAMTALLDPLGASFRGETDFPTAGAPEIPDRCRSSTTPAQIASDGENHDL